MEMHAHEKCIEIVVVLKGNETFCIENETFDLVGGDVCFSFANQPHKSGDLKQGVCEAFFILVNPYVESDFLGLNNHLGDQLKTTLKNLRSHLFKADRECLMLLDKVFKNLNTHKNTNVLYTQSMFVGFLSKLLYSQKPAAKFDVTINDIVEYIDSKIYEDIRNEDICEKFNISLSSYRHKFKELVGMTPRLYINSKKVNIAKQLLKSGKSVTETAMSLSFNTSDYFSAVFKKYTGETPTNLRPRE